MSTNTLNLQPGESFTDPMVPPLGHKSPFHVEKQYALEYFNPQTNPDGCRYLQMYYQLYYRENMTRHAFHEIVGQMGISNIEKHEHQIRILTEAIRTPAQDPSDPVLADMLSTGVKSIPVCENFCIAYTFSNPDENGNAGDSSRYKCPRCSATGVARLEYLSPRLIISHLMGSSQMARLIKTAPAVKPQACSYTTFFTQNALRMKKLGMLNSPHDLLFALIVDDSNSYLTDDAELIQINLVLLNLPASERSKPENTFPIFFIPRESKHGERVVGHTYYQAVVDDFKSLGENGMWVFDADLGKWVVMHAYLGFISGDLISSSSQMGYSNFFGGDCPCKACGLKRFFFKTITNTHHSGFFSFHSINYQLVRTQAFVKNVEWYNRICSLYPFDPEAWKFPDQVCKEYGITDKNVFLELRSIFLPDSFPFDVMSISLDGVLRTILNLLFGGPSCYDRPEYKYSWTEKGQERVREVISWINLAKGWGYSTEEPYNVDNILGGVINCFTFGQLRELFQLFSILYFEAFQGKDREDKLLAEFNLLRRIASSQQLTPEILKFLEASFDNVIKLLEVLITRNYTATKNVTIFTLYIHLVLHIVDYIRRCGDISAFVSPERDKFTKLMQGYNRPASHYIQAIMNYRTRAIAVQALSPVIFTFSVGFCRFENEVKSFPLTETQQSWNIDKIDPLMINPSSKVGQHVETIKILGHINRLVWKFYNSDGGLDLTKEQLCMVAANGSVSFPEGHSIFLVPETCRRFEAVYFGSNNKSVPRGSVLRLEDANDSTSQPVYIYSREFVNITVAVADLEGRVVRNVTRDFILFTTMTGLERKMEKAEAMRTEVIFPPKDEPDTNEDEEAEPINNSYINFGYYYQAPLTAEIRNLIKTNYSLQMFPPKEGTWGLVPIEQISNPVYSFPIVSEQNADIVNVHLYDQRLECGIIVDGKEHFINGTVGEYDVNVEYAEAMKRGTV